MNSGATSLSLEVCWSGRVPGMCLREPSGRYLYLIPWLSNRFRRIGIEARRKLVAPVGAWFSRLGRLHQVHHLWQYPYVSFHGGVPLFLSLGRDFETRSEIRDKAWQQEGWSDTVHKVLKTFASPAKHGANSACVDNSTCERDGLNNSSASSVFALAIVRGCNTPPIHLFLSEWPEGDKNWGVWR